jgi:hypothetical protein
VGVAVTGTITVYPGGTYAATDPLSGVDGWRSVADHATRNALGSGTPLRCRQGMAVYTQSDGLVWVLNTATPAGTDADWTPFGGGSGGTVSYGAAAGRPAPGTAGNLYIPSDGLVTSLDTGSSWVGYMPGNAIMTIPPVVADWTALHGTITTASDIPGGGIVLAAIATGSDTLSGISRPLSAPTGYTITAAMRSTYQNSNGRTGIFISDGTQFCTVGWRGDGVLLASLWNTATSYGGNLYSGQTIALGGSLFWLRITDDGTHRTYWCSTDGLYWVNFYYENSSINITDATSTGIWLYSDADDLMTDNLLLSWSGA